MTFAVAPVLSLLLYGHVKRLYREEYISLLSVCLLFTIFSFTRMMHYDSLLSGLWILLPYILRKSHDKLMWNVTGSLMLITIYMQHFSNPIYTCLLLILVGSIVVLRNKEYVHKYIEVMIYSLYSVCISCSYLNAVSQNSTMAIFGTLFILLFISNLSLKNFWKNCLGNRCWKP